MAASEEAVVIRYHQCPFRRSLVADEVSDAGDPQRHIDFR
jgi:hypothetical protein